MKIRDPAIRVLYHQRSDNINNLDKGISMKKSLLAQCTIIAVGLFHGIMSQTVYIDSVQIIDISNHSKNSLKKMSASNDVPDFSGNLLYSSDKDGDYELYSMSATGADFNNAQQLTFNSSKDSRARYYSNGKKIAFVRDDAQIFTIDADGKNETYITDGSRVDISPANDNLMSIINQDGDLLTYEISSGTSKELLTSDIYKGTYDAPAWSPDGKYIAFMNTFLYSYPFVKNIGIINSDGGDPTYLTDFTDIKEGYCYFPQWSPDGSKIIFNYNSSSTGYGVVAIMNADGTNQKELASANSDLISPIWSHDGKYIVCNYNGRLICFLYEDVTKAWLLTPEGEAAYPLDWIKDTSEVKSKVSRNKPNSDKESQVKIVTNFNTQNFTIVAEKAIKKISVVDANGRTITQQVPSTSKYNTCNITMPLAQARLVFVHIDFVDGGAVTRELFRQK